MMFWSGDTPLIDDIYKARSHAQNLLMMRKFKPLEYKNQCCTLVHVCLQNVVNVLIFNHLTQAMFVECLPLAYGTHLPFIFSFLFLRIDSLGTSKTLVSDYLVLPIVFLIVLC